MDRIHREVMLKAVMSWVPGIVRKIKEEEMGETKQKYYYLNYICSNCRVKERKAIKFGERAPKTTTCKNCGCWELKRNDWDVSTPIVVKPGPDSDGTSSFRWIP